MITPITRPNVGKIVRIRTADGRNVEGRVAWSEEGAWRLAGSSKIYRAPGDTVLWQGVKRYLPPLRTRLHDRAWSLLKKLRWWGA